MVQKNACARNSRIGRAHRNSSGLEPFTVPSFLQLKHCWMPARQLGHRKGSSCLDTWLYRPWGQCSGLHTSALQSGFLQLWPSTMPQWNARWQLPSHSRSTPAHVG